MKRFISLLILLLTAMPASAQFFFPSGGNQDGGQGSGGDEKAVYSFNVNTRWNMVSVPLLVDSYLKTSLFPTAISNAFAFEGAYVTKDTLKNGIGYWLKYP